MVDLDDDTLYLTILAHPVRVLFKTSDQMPDALGETDRYTSTISVRGDMAPSLVFATLLHEAIHVGETILGYELPEHVIDAVSATIYSLLRDNRKVWEMFDSALRDKDI